MGILAPAADERVKDVKFTEDMLIVELMDGRTISVPLAWYPKLLNATPEQRYISLKSGQIQQIVDTVDLSHWHIKKLVAIHQLYDEPTKQLQPFLCKFVDSHSKSSASLPLKRGILYLKSFQSQKPHKRVRGLSGFL